MNPNFFLVGTTKGGTSSLDLWLRHHPDVATPRRKEMHFFCHCPNPKLKVVDNLDDYLAAFPAGKAVGESSPCYLYYPDVPEQLTRFPEVRIAISLRDPVERFWSHYLMNEIYRPTGLAPEEVLQRNLASGPTNALEDLYGVGKYAGQVRRYLQTFGTDNVLILFLEETATAPDRAMDRLQRHLGLEPLPLDTSEVDKQHVEPRGAVGRLFLRTAALRRIGNVLLPTSARRFLKSRVLGDPTRKPRLSDELRGQLREAYSTDSLELEDLLARPLPWEWHRPR